MRWLCALENLSRTHTHPTSLSTLLVFLSGASSLLLAHVNLRIDLQKCFSLCAPTKILMIQSWFQVPWLHIHSQLEWIETCLYLKYIYRLLTFVHIHLFAFSRSLLQPWPFKGIYFLKQFLCAAMFYLNWDYYNESSFSYQCKDWYGWTDKNTSVVLSESKINSQCSNLTCVKVCAGLFSVHRTLAVIVLSFWDALYSI